MPNTSPFSRAAIIGTGLIGGSFALALRKSFPEISIVGFDRPDALQKACAREAIQDSFADIASAVRGADLIYIALPIGATIDALPTIAAHAGATALVTDAGGTKTVICRTAKEHFRDRARFLGGHPMAGREHSGVEFADAELFRGASYALIGNGEDSDPRVASFESVVRGIGARPEWVDAETHDWAVGIVSHLPQLLAIALARTVQDETDETGLPLSLAGPGLQDVLRLAGSPYGMWRDIVHTNTENISRAMDRLAQAVEHLRTRLTSKELEGEFRAANEIYKTLHKPR